jgi:hypothetical protein
MKNLLVALFTGIALSGMCQNNMFEGINALGSDAKYQVFKVNQDKENGYYFSRQMDGEEFTIRVEKNKFGDDCGITAQHTTKNDDFFWMEYNPRYYGVDHYTHPGFAGGLPTADDNGTGFIFMDNIIFELEDISQDWSSFTIAKAWATEVEMEDTEGEEKKLTMKERVALAKLKMASLGAPACLVAKSGKELKNEITAHIESMRKVQAENPYSSEVTGKLAELLADDDALTDDINKRNNEYWASEEGQRKLNEMQTPMITLVNDTGHDVGIYYGSGASKTLKPGEEHTTRCQDFLGDVHHGIARSGSSQLDQGELLFDADGTNCGATINISSL